MKIYELAEKHCLDVVTTTPDPMGYPRDLKLALTGFLSWDEVEEVAAETAGTIVTISRKPGWACWTRTLRAATGPINVQKLYEREDNALVVPFAAIELFKQELRDGIHPLRLSDCEYMLDAIEDGEFFYARCDYSGAVYEQGIEKCLRMGYSDMEREYKIAITIN